MRSKEELWEIVDSLENGRLFIQLLHREGNQHIRDVELKLHLPCSIVSGMLLRLAEHELVAAWSPHEGGFIGLGENGKLLFANGKGKP